MRTLLDGILEATEATMTGGNVVSVNNDLSKIGTDGMTSGFVDPGESARSSIDDFKRRIAELESGGGGWDAAEFGISRAEQVQRFKRSLAAAEEALAESQTPAGRAKAVALLAQAEADLRERAIRRAGLDTTGGKVRVMVAGDPAWHKLGINVREAVGSAQAIKLAGLDWPVVKQQLSYQWGDSVRKAGSWAILRGDTGEELGIVGSRYEPIQNAEGFAFLDELLGQFDARYETAGSTFGGSRVWMQVRLPRQAFTVAPGDEVEAFALFMNPHDGSGVAECFPTSNRVVCANTLRVAIAGQDKGKALRIRHTGNVKAKVAAAQSALGLAVEAFDDFKESAETLARTKLADPRGYFDGVLDHVLEITAAQAKMGAANLADSEALALAVTATEERERLVKRWERRIEDRGQALADILERYESDRCKVGGIAGTAWAGLNAVTEHADYSNGGRQMGTAEERLSRRFESIIDGDRDELKQYALSDALELAR